MAKWCLCALVALVATTADLSAQSLSSSPYAGIGFGRVLWDDDTIDWHYAISHVSVGWEVVSGDQRTWLFEGSLANRNFDLLNGDIVRNRRLELLVGARFYGSLERSNPLYAEAGLAGWALERCIVESPPPFGIGSTVITGCGNTNLDPNLSGFRAMIGAGVKASRLHIAIRHHFAGTFVYRGGGISISETTTELKLSVGLRG